MSGILVLYALPPVLLSRDLSAPEVLVWLWLHQSFRYVGGGNPKCVPFFPHPAIREIWSGGCVFHVCLGAFASWKQTKGRFCKIHMFRTEYVLLHAWARRRQLATPFSMHRIRYVFANGGLLYLVHTSG